MSAYRMGASGPGHSVDRGCGVSGLVESIAEIRRVAQEWRERSDADLALIIRSMPDLELGFRLASWRAYQNLAARLGACGSNYSHGEHAERGEKAARARRFADAYRERYRSDIEEGERQERARR